MDIEIVRETISGERLREIARATHGDMAKAVVDVERAILAVGGEMHADAEALLLDDGSKQEDLWGINLYPENVGEDIIEFTSLINIRPASGSRSMDIQDERLRQRITRLIHTRISL